MRKNSKILKILAIIALIFLVLTLPIRSLNSKAENNSTPLLFLGNHKIAPIVYEQNGVTQGIAVDLVKTFEEKIDHQIEVRALDWVEAQSKVLTGQADALIQFNPNPEREILYDFSDEFLESEFSIFTASSNTYIHSVDDLIDRTVGVEKGGYAHNLLLKHEGIRIVEIASVSHGLDLISAGALDATVSDRWLGEYELTQSDRDSIRIVEEPIERQYSRIAVKKGNTELLELINQGLREIKADSTMEDIIESWKGKKVLYVTEERVIRLALYVVIGTIAIIFSIGFFLVNKYRTLSRQLELDVEARNQELQYTNHLLKDANEKLEKLSITDKLTDLYNRRFFDRALTKEWQIARRNKHSLALIMIDIDQFKAFNDTFGHLAGDRCLESIAQRMQKTVKRSGDVVARYGGEEFAVLLPNTSTEGALILAEEIREAVENLINYYDGKKAKVTVSLGVAALIPDALNEPEDLISIADKALYQAKATGRNRAVVYEVRNDAEN